MSWKKKINKKGCECSRCGEMVRNSKLLIIGHEIVCLGCLRDRENEIFIHDNDCEENDCEEFEF